MCEVKDCDCRFVGGGDVPLQSFLWRKMLDVGSGLCFLFAQCFGSQHKQGQYSDQCLVLMHHWLELNHTCIHPSFQDQGYFITGFLQYECSLTHSCYFTTGFNDINVHELIHVIL